MLKYPEISPIIFQIGPVALRWYGLMYAISFFLLINIMRRQAAKGFLPLTEMMVERLFVMLVVCILLGARIFYVIFYGPEIFSQGLFEVFAIWHGGLSFHGGLAGIVLATIIVARQNKTPWVSIVDTLVLVGPIGIAFGRLGNFANGELWGRVTNVPWGMVFPHGGPLPRHPSQIYECLLEGVLLALVLWIAKSRVRRYGILTSIFLIGYGIARIFCEFFREPDAQLGFILGPFTMGQLLSLAVLIPGVAMLIWALKNGPLIKEIQERRSSAKANFKGCAALKPAK